MNVSTPNLKVDYSQLSVLSFRNWSMSSFALHLHRQPNSMDPLALDLKTWLASDSSKECSRSVDASSLKNKYEDVNHEHNL